MVFLTVSCWIRSRGPDRYWKVQEVLKHARLWITRIAAASREHGMKYPALVHNLTKSSVQLNRRVISDLAITEPKSFLSLAKLAQARQQEGLRAALGNGKEPAGVFSRVVLLQ
uniref:Large ribosomal subunit protein bL20m n=1 Tax=Mola mola TaxID=94237 RepID=A0A3Q3XSB7_MOLML